MTMTPGHVERDGLSMFSIPPDLVADSPVGADELHVQPHHTHGVRRAAQAGVERADARLEAVQDALGDLRCP